MALTTHRIGPVEHYPWGHMVRVDFRDEAGTLSHDTMLWHAEPSPGDITERAEAVRVATETRLAAQAPEPVEIPAEHALRDAIPHVWRLIDQLQALADYVMTLPASGPRTRILAELVDVRDTLTALRDAIKAVR